MTPFRGLAWAAALGFLAAPPVAGQRTFFNPALSLWVVYADDVEFSGESVSDTSYRLQAELPLRRELERGFFELGFAPFLERYERSDGLDDEGHRTRLILGLEPSAVSAFEANARVQRTQDRDPLRDFEDQDLFLTPRIRRELEMASLQYRREASAVWSWDLTTLYSQWDFKALDEVPDGDPAVPEGRRDVEAEVGVYRMLSARTTTGLRLGRRRYDLEVSGHETLDVASLYLERLLSRHWELELLIGGFNRSGSVVGGDSVTTSGPQGSMTLTRTYRRAALTARAASLLTSGGELPGTAELRLFEVSLDDSGLEPGGWHLQGRHVRRVPSVAGLPAADLTTVAAAIEWEFHRLVGLRFEAVYADQSGESVLDETYYRIGAAVVVYPLGRTRLGGGGGDASGDD